MPVPSAGQGYGSWAGVVAGPTSHVSLPQQQVALQVTPYNPVPVGRWFTILLGPVPEGFQTPQVWIDLYPQVIAAHTEHKKGRVSIQLLFKRSLPCNELKVILDNWAATHGAEVMAITIDALHTPSERYMGSRDLEYIDQVYAHARNQQELDDLMAITPPLIKDKESRARYGEFFLNYDLYPPVVGPPMSREQRLRPLQIVEFDTAWLVSQLARLSPQTVDLPLH
jgi:hypothetical protein